MDVTGVAIVIAAERGARAVVFADQDIDAAQTASEESKCIASSKCYETLALHVDVCDRQSVKRVIAEVKENFSRLAYAVNCAGAIDETEYDNLHDVNAKGVLHCLQEEISAMKDQEPIIGPGSIINITSLSAVLGTAQSATYVAIKLAARGIIKCAATPEENANVVHFLARPGASFVNGQSIMVDSGVSVNILT
ncbi:oxidoreductase [Xylariaceae sp. FL1272]|nr:oxidoreductase [Xylariaceae sp. FL1272]